MADETFQRTVTVVSQEPDNQGKSIFKGQLDGKETSSKYRFPNDVSGSVSVGDRLRVTGHYFTPDGATYKLLMVDSWEKVEKTSPAPVAPPSSLRADSPPKKQGEFRTAEQIMRGQAFEIAVRSVPQDEPSYDNLDYAARHIYFLIKDGFGMKPEDVARELEGDVDDDSIPF
jgi:hypothetical protein